MLVVLLGPGSFLRKEIHYEQCFVPALVQVVLEQRP